MESIYIQNSNMEEFYVQNNRTVDKKKVKTVTVNTHIDMKMVILQFFWLVVPTDQATS